ncbi:tetratricopeptide repeat protein [Vibrio mexicanus]|uniref:tetratricopeptide repeat protein n=1 Tax=Vibrio mexicanus TaxID=1004326 RepID=UPI00063C7D0E|nr:tetratricopeptide repeat protein [Vibrio mexicanus]
MKWKATIATLLCLSLIGCASDPKQPQVDTALYDGRPIDTLSLQEPPVTEKEAITRGDLALSQNNVDLALYEYIRSLSFENAQFRDKSLFNIGRIHQSRGNLALAEKAYLLGLKENPNNVQVLEQLGVLYSTSGQTDTGFSYLLRSVNSDQLRLNSTHQLSNEESITEADVEKLVIDASSPANAYMGLGILTDVKAKHELAQEFYNKALTIKPKSVKALINVGYSYYMSGDYMTAQRFTLTALDIAPSNEKALNNLALIYLGKGETKRAVNVFMRQMDAAEALNNVGYFLILHGKPDQAIPYLEQAIDKKPTYYKVANENLERALAEVREKSRNSEQQQ